MQTPMAVRFIIPTTPYFVQHRCFLKQVHNTCTVFTRQIIALAEAGCQQQGYALGSCDIEKP
jgi:hypothetical protein